MGRLGRRFILIRVGEVSAELADNRTGVFSADRSTGIFLKSAPVLECLFNGPVFSKGKQNPFARLAISTIGLNKVMAVAATDV